VDAQLPDQSKWKSLGLIASSMVSIADRPTSVRAADCPVRRTSRAPTPSCPSLLAARRAMPALAADFGRNVVVARPADVLDRKT
jgi:hypothetical protein